MVPGNFGKYPHPKPVAKTYDVIFSSFKIQKSMSDFTYNSTVNFV